MSDSADVVPIFIVFGFEVWDVLFADVLEKWAVFLQSKVMSSAHTVFIEIDHGAVERSCVFDYWIWSRIRLSVSLFTLELGQVFNVVKTGLFWNCLPIKAVGFETERSAPGHKLTTLNKCCRNICQGIVYVRRLSWCQWRGLSSNQVSCHFESYTRLWKYVTDILEWFAIDCTKPGHLVMSDIVIVKRVLGQSRGGGGGTRGNIWVLWRSRISAVPESIHHSCELVVCFVCCSVA